jgi:hypothetical protein
MIALTFFLSVFAIALIIQTPNLSRSQASGSKPQFNDVVRDLQLADSSGATINEMHRLVTQLNSVLQMQEQLNNSSPQNTAMRMQLAERINSTLASVDSQAIQFATSAKANTATNHLIGYSLAPIGATIGTALYYYSILLWRKYRTKRTLRMKISMP